MRPQTLTDFRKLGKRKLSPRTAKEAKELHDKRRLAAQETDTTFFSVPSLPFETLNLRRRYAKMCVEVPLGGAGRDYLDQARKDYPQRQNWDGVFATGDRSGWCVRDISHGRYSSRCTFTRWSYRVEVTSTAFVTPRRIWFWFSDNKAKRIDAPHGYHWDRDRNGLRLVANADGDVDYHPSASDLLNLTKRGLAEKVRENAKVRKEVARQKRKELAAVKRAEAEGATVCLKDSVRSGNCHWGTVSWAKRHGLDPVRHYKPSEVLALANGETNRVALVVTVALRRHRQEMERGYAELADHR